MMPRSRQMSAMTAPIGRRRTSAAICSGVGRQIPGSTPGSSPGAGTRASPKVAVSVGRAVAARAGDRRHEGAGSASRREAVRIILASSASARRRPRVMRARIRAISLAPNGWGLLRSAAANSQ
jgi:hypothetical protein